NAGLDRWLAAIALAAVVILYLPTALVITHYPVPAPFTSCHVHCPRNVFMGVGPQPASVGRVPRPLRELITVVLFVIVAVRLAAKIRAAGTLVRLTLTPVLVASISWVVLLAAGLVTRRIIPSSVALHVTLWLTSLAVAAIALAFVVG